MFGNKNHEGELKYGMATPMKNPQFLAKVLRITAAFLTMLAQIVIACMG
jgi:hypothetical protein